MPRGTIPPQFRIIARTFPNVTLRSGYSSARIEKKAATYNASRPGGGVNELLHRHSPEPMATASSPPPKFLFPSLTHVCFAYVARQSRDATADSLSAADNPAMVGGHQIAPRLKSEALLPPKSLFHLGRQPRV
ncbi:hypothetical protein Pla22_03590 [Rubripirellula amarantea]|uniref:Uncharacterized protein n=1 Tax=Rubripirellula amarantea TaxID=2527999 RepID=A0A5C5WRQ6_9BACT|nr:hypothetical protein Pla22_03590 [Rubripirellula amarantea]